MAVSMDQALKAYTDASQAWGKSQGIEKQGNSDTALPSAQDFSAMLKNAVRSSIDQQRQGEEMAMAAVAGKANLSDVVTSMAEARVVLETFVAVRDRAIEAYKEIIRMPI